jgi:hypothetical protein
MLDFAASLLAELEAWMLQASPAMVDLATFPDISHAFNGPPSVVDDIQKRMYSDEVRWWKFDGSRLVPVSAVHSWPWTERGELLNSGVPLL